MDVLGREGGAEELECIEAGALTEPFIAIVKIVHKATGLVLGEDNLCGCVYESNEDFMKGSMYFQDMVSSAIADARETKRKLCAA